LKDYYAILGLDADASTDSIKLAYRRLAREHHPDRVGPEDKEAQEQASQRMADLNEAYAVLSDSKQRREYNSKWRTVFAPAAAAAEDMQAAIDAIAAEQQKAAVSRARARPAAELRTSVVREYSAQVLKDLLAKKKVFNWKSSKFEGFDWALEASFLFSHYWTALRVFPVMDRAAVQKFSNYANLAMDKHKSWLRANYFLFLIAFQRITDPDRVMALCRTFVQTEGRSTLQGTSTLIVLLDAAHGRSILCGAQPGDKRFSQLLQQIRTRPS